MLTESTLFALAGGVVGVLFSYWAKDLGRLFVPPAPLAIEINQTINGGVLRFAAGVTLVTAFAFGLVPALQGTASSVMSALEDSATAVTATPRRARLRKGLVVAQVALSLMLLISSDMSAAIDGYTPAPNEVVTLYDNRVGSDYLNTMGIPLLAGREFNDLDTPERPEVVIVNDTPARRYFAGRDPVGGRICIGRRTLHVIGVARDGKYSQIAESPRPFMYLPARRAARIDPLQALRNE